MTPKYLQLLWTVHELYLRVDPAPKIDINNQGQG